MIRHLCSLAGHVGKDSRGSVAVIFALALIPMMLAVGMAVDLARLVVAQTELQAAVDSAALAGVSAYQTSTQSTKATTAAANFFARYVPNSGLTVGSPVVTSGTGVSGVGYTSYTVTVSVTATMSTTLMSLAHINSLSLTASATAANPMVQPIIMTGPPGSDAADWNAVYMYAIPTNASGQPIYSQMPTFSDLYEIESNCNAASDTNWTAASACNAKPGGTIPVNQTFPQISGTQPLGFIFENMMTGQAPVGSSGIYGYLNAYNAGIGNISLFSTAWVNSAPGVFSGNGPAYLTDESTTLIPTLTGTLPAQNTKYTARIPAATPNCSLAIQIVDPNNVPSAWAFYEQSGVPTKCWAPSATNVGLQYANMSCVQMNGQTFMYWWNDMGGNPDDKNYIDLYYTIRCVPGYGSPNGGQLYTGTTVPPTGTLSVSLIK